MVGYATLHPPYKWGNYFIRLKYYPILNIDLCHVTCYIFHMIKTFADRYTRELYQSGKSKRFPPEIARRATRKIEYIDLATCLDDLSVPPGNRLHELGQDPTSGVFASVSKMAMPTKSN